MSLLKSSMIAIFICFSFALFAQNKEADLIKGEWYTEGNESMVKIFKATNGKYYGKLAWLDEPNEEDGTPKVDDNNPDSKKHKDPLLGLMLLKGFTYSDGEWSNGTIYDPKNGKTYKCTIKTDGKDKLNVRGFIGISVLGRTTLWIRKN